MFFINHKETIVHPDGYSGDDFDSDIDYDTYHKSGSKILDKFFNTLAAFFIPVVFVGFLAVLFYAFLSVVVSVAKPVFEYSHTPYLKSNNKTAIETIFVPKKMKNKL